MTDFHESLRQEAEKRCRERTAHQEEYVNESRVGDVLFGAQAALNLLGRSATSEGHPPRVWLEPHVPEKGATFEAHNSHTTATYTKRYAEQQEFCAVSEMQSLRAADLLEIERIKNRKCGECSTHLAQSMSDHKALSQAREARKGDSAEIERLKTALEANRANNEVFRSAMAADWHAELTAEREKSARLTAALEKIANRDNLPWQPHALHCIARESIAEENK